MLRSEPGSTVRARVHHGICAAWAGLAAGGPLLASPGWLRAMRGRLGDRLVTAVVDGPGGACLAALGSVQPAPRPGEFFDLHHVLVSPAPALPLAAGARAAREALATTAPGPARWAPSLVMMLPGYECVPVGPAAGDAVAASALVDATLEWAAAAGIPTVGFLYTRPESTALTAALAGRGFVAVPLSLTWDLPVPVDGMPGYLRGLSRHRRGEVDRELHRLAGAGVSLRAIDPAEATTGPVLRTLTGLRCQLVRKYRGTADERVELGRLSALAHDVAAGRPVVFVAEADGVPVGFALFAAHGGDWHCLAVGYDYTDPRSRLAYFGTAFYAAVPPAAGAGVRWLRYGQGSTHAKRARGCVGTPLTGWVHSTDPELAAAARASAAVTALDTDP